MLTRDVSHSEGIQRISGEIVDLAFPLRGDTIPADHGYALFGAISRQLPSFHSDMAIGVHPVRGRLAGERRLALTPMSRLVLRLPVARVPEAIRLAGRYLDLDGSRCLVGVPTVHSLIPAASLHSRLVVIRGFTEPEGFLGSVRRKLEEMGIEGQASLVLRSSSRPIEGRSEGGTERYIRRTQRIRDKSIVGYAVRVEQLTAEESLVLQEIGLGGRRHFGCGIFLASRPGKVET